MPCWFSIEQNKYGFVLRQDSVINKLNVAGTPGVRRHWSSSSQDSGWIRQWLGSGHGSVPELPECQQQTAGCSKHAQVSWSLFSFLPATYQVTTSSVTSKQSSKHHQTPKASQNHIISLWISAYLCLSPIMPLSHQPLGILSYLSESQTSCQSAIIPIILPPPLSLSVSYHHAYLPSCLSSIRITRF